MAKVRAFDCGWLKCVERLPFVTKDLNLVKTRITDVNVATFVYSQSGTAICIAQIQGAQEMAPRIENLNARVSCIEHEQFTIGHDYLAGEPELTGAVTAATSADPANQLPPLVHNKDHVSLPVPPENAPRSLIYCHPSPGSGVVGRHRQQPRPQGAPREPMLQRHAVQELHDDEGLALLPNLMDRADVGMV